jgi:RNA polymerase sigma-70 factor (ECF subfamily)
MNLVSRATPGISVEPRTINGQPGVLLRRGERVLMATAVEILDGQVAALYTIVNPDKLL